ncbi:MAG: arylesterase [Burkholderiaceae bacterium]|nr:MAG: arylesterase [Burkholderiaceae bacterium]TBR75004.1 MAG: arylesterase [Burkholderiaceae bacterium]
MRAWGAQNKPGAAAAAVARPPRTILVLGDSLSAEYGLPRGSGWVALLQKRLADENIAAIVKNASISGETTSGGRSRLAALLGADKPGIVILELGANDALRGLPLAMTQDNLHQMTRAAQKAGARVLLLGMQVPPNYGSEYADRFAAIYGEVAKADKAALVPFFLKGVADAPNAAELFQSDGLHPIAAAHPTLLNNVWPELKKLLE